jgi:LPS sulfotransferase NodH
MPEFTSFVVLAEMRTGSNLLETYLNEAPGVTCHAELFNPSFIDHPKTETVCGYDFAARERDPLGLLAAVRAEGGADRELVGFRLFHDHDPRVRDHVLDDPACAKIILTRNPLEMHVSRKVAAATDQWRLYNVARRRSAKVRFDPQDFAADLQRWQDSQRLILNRLQVTGQGAFFIHYDDLNDLAVVNGLLRWLGVVPGLTELPRHMKKQNPGPIEDLLENPQDLAPGLSRIDRFDLGRTPNFEPRRGPMLNACLAAARAPVLFMPLRGAPEGGLTGWLAALDSVGPEALLRDFDAARLRDWRARHTRRRSFTVLRHPLLRAHLAFCRKVLTGEFEHVREHLARLYDVRLHGDASGLPPDAHRAAFLGYLQFCRASLSGQTGLQPWPIWASQAALLDGFAEAGAPDLILREDRLASGLAHLCAELDLPCPADAVPAPESGTIPLAAIADAEIAAACRAAYWRDYEQFGFDDLP